MPRLELYEATKQRQEGNTGVQIQRDGSSDKAYA